MWDRLYGSRTGTVAAWVSSKQLHHGGPHADVIIIDESVRVSDDLGFATKFKAI
jgi:hypothetical protein